jgi:uncharacterized membrane-anchored protein
VNPFISSALIAMGGVMVAAARRRGYGPRSMWLGWIAASGVIVGTQIADYLHQPL